MSGLGDLAENKTNQVLDVADGIGIAGTNLTVADLLLDPTNFGQVFTEASVTLVVMWSVTGLFLIGGLVCGIKHWKSLRAAPSTHAFGGLYTAMVQIGLFALLGGFLVVLYPPVAPQLLLLKALALSKILSAFMTTLQYMVDDFSDVSGFADIMKPTEGDGGASPMNKLCDLIRVKVGLMGAKQAQYTVPIFQFMGEIIFALVGGNAAGADPLDSGARDTIVILNAIAVIICLVCLLVVWPSMDDIFDDKWQLSKKFPSVMIIIFGLGVQPLMFNLLTPTFEKHFVDRFSKAEISLFFDNFFLTVTSSVALYMMMKGYPLSDITGNSSAGKCPNCSCDSCKKKDPAGPDAN